MNKAIPLKKNDRDNEFNKDIIFNYNYFQYFLK